MRLIAIIHPALKGGLPTPGPQHNSAPRPDPGHPVDRSLEVESDTCPNSHPTEDGAMSSKRANLMMSVCVFVS